MNYTTEQLGIFLLFGLVLILTGSFLAFGAVACGIEAILVGVATVATAMNLHRNQG